MKELTPPAPLPPQGSEIRCEVTVTSQVHDASDYYSKSQGPNSPRSTHIEETEVPDALRERYPVITPSQPSFRGIQTTVAAARPRIRTLDANKATLSYCKTALLFFFALLCTWYVIYMTIIPYILASLPPYFRSPCALPYLMLDTDLTIVL